MRERISRNETTETNSAGGLEAQFVDFPENHLDPVLRDRSARSSPSEDAVAGSLRRHDPDDPAPQPVGGRRRFRPEVVLVLAGSVFLVAALLKPWSSVTPAHMPVATPAGGSTELATVVPARSVGPVGPVAQVETPAATAWQSPIGWPDVPQWDYGWPVASASQPPGGSEAAADPRWTAVDWTVLGSLDPHDGWGYGTAIMPDLAQLPSSATPPSPVTTWVPAGPPRYTTINVVHGSQIFGLAVTWPHSVEVRSVTVGYIGGPQHPANMPPAGFPAYAQVSPLPAAQVASSAGADTGAIAASSPTQQAVGAAGTLGSGQFWIAPSAVSSGTASASIPSAWRSQPWPWPDGIYTVTITSTAGVTNYLLSLQTS